MPPDLPGLASEIGQLLPAALRRTATPARTRAREQLAEAFSRFDPRTPLLVEWSRGLDADIARSAPECRTWLLERAEAAAWAREGRTQREAYLAARATFARHNLRLVIHIAKDFQGKGADLTDLIQEGNIALLRAVEKFDDRRGFRFSTYGGWWIVQALQRCAQRDGHLIALPSDLLDDQRRVRDRDTQLRATLGRAPTDAEVGEAAGISALRLDRAKTLGQSPRSLDAAVFDGEKRTIADVVADPNALDPLECIAEGARGRLVAKLLTRVDAREQRILRARFGIAGTDERTLQQLADELGLSRERVRQLEQRALERLEGVAEELGVSDSG